MTMREEKTMKLTAKIKNDADELYEVPTIDKALCLCPHGIGQRIVRAYLQEQGWYGYKFPISTGEQKVLVILTK